MHDILIQFYKIANWKINYKYINAKIKFNKIKKIKNTVWTV